MNTITANELKVRGVSALEEITTSQEETVITVRGKSKYIVLSVDTYNYLRECELEAALIESKKDIEEGKFFIDSVEDHIKRITDA